MSFICIIIKNHFHINGLALSLALKVRFFGTRKRPILSVSVFLQFKLISIHASKSAHLFHVYISRINSAMYRMIRWKRKKGQISWWEIRWKHEKLIKKLLTLAWIISGSSFPKSEFFCSCPLLAQTEFLNIALECRIPLGNLRDALLSATDLIYNTTFFPKWEGSVNFVLQEG